MTKKVGVTRIVALTWWFLLCLPGPAWSGPLLDIAYGSEPLQKLDVYPISGQGHRVVVFVHGGSWRSGDKSNIKMNPRFAQFFEDGETVLVSLNFRLLPEATWNQQVQDVTTAVAWVRKHIHRYGGDPDRIVLFGYSSGAHLVALATSDPARIPEGTVAGAVCFDVIAYDVPRAIAKAAEHGHPVTQSRLPRFFGQDQADQMKASPVHHLSAKRDLPNFLIVYAIYQGPVRQTLSQDQSVHFAEAIRRNGGRAEVRGFSGSHNGLVRGFGDQTHPPTKWVKSFLNRF